MKSSHAFSLVELSIVLVILGLLVGGVLSGQSLIHAAKLRSIPTEHGKISTATKTFRDKYFMLPGDMNNATQFWGAAAAAGPACALFASTDAKTCDGNGDGRIANNGGSAEEFRFPQHLANAGMMEGNYPGNCCSTNNRTQSRFDNGVWIITNVAPVPANSHAIYFAGQYGNVMEYAGKVDYALTASDAWSIDKKMDDGVPGGSVSGWKGVDATTWPCTSAAGIASDIGATYNLTNNERNCLMFFQTGL